MSDTLNNPLPEGGQQPDGEVTPFDPMRLDPDYQRTEKDNKRLRRYNLRKKISAVLQGIMLFSLIGFITYLIFHTGEPQPLYPPREQWTQRDGFVALSYTGLVRKDRVDRRGNRAVSRELFESHMHALVEAGYHIITTQDVIDFYWHGAPLPDRALYLMFEGGRKDSAIFSQDAIKELNLRATMFVQTSRLTRGDHFFIRTTELGVLAKNPYWDIGSQGYELRYINQTEDGGYKFFLTDYLRDENKDPIETDDELRARLEEDYELSFRPVAKYAEEEPQVYIFMPANTLWRSMESSVERINAELLDKYYKLVFAREGDCYNTQETAAYNLTRMQVGGDWSVNRLLMEIEAFSPNRHVYHQTDEERGYLWRTESGALVMDDGMLILTAPKDEEAMAWLRGTDIWDNVDVTTYFVGDARGEQKLYLRYVSHQANICATLSRSILTIEETVPGRGTSTLARIPIAAELYSDPSSLPDGPSLRAVKLRFTLLGSRMMIRAGEQERLLTPDAVPMSTLTRKGRIAIAAFGEDEPYDAVFENLVALPIAQRWILPDIEAQFDRISGRGAALYTSLILPLSREDARWEERGPQLLYQALAVGEKVYASLPVGSYDLNELRQPWRTLPADFFARLISGVVLNPGENPDLNELAGAAERVAASGLETVICLTEENARLLAESDVRPPADWLIYNFAGQLPEELDIRLKSHYDQRRFLRVVEEDQTMPGSYIYEEEGRR